jgi:periplasmic protein TonB
MKAKKHVESLEEIIFKERNKQYGAYALRRNYGNHVIVALFIAVLFIGSALTYPLMNRPEDIKPNVGDTITIIVEPIRLKTPEPTFPRIPVVPPPVKPVDKSLVFVTPKVSSEPGDNQDFGKQDVMANAKPVPVAPLPEPGNEGAPNPEPVMTDPTPPPPRTWVEEMPHFPGGDNQLKTFLLSSIKYPQEARELNIQGTVYLEFVVEPDGSITNIVVKRGPGGGLEEEALRVVKSMPLWTPGKQNGTAVRVRLTLPVKFTLH